MWWRERASGTSQAMGWSQEDSSLCQSDPGEMGVLQTLGPFITKLRTHAWPGSQRHGNRDLAGVECAAPPQPHTSETRPQAVTCVRYKKAAAALPASKSPTRISLVLTLTRTNRKENLRKLIHSCQVDTPQSQHNIIKTLL